MKRIKVIAGFLTVLMIEVVVIFWYRGQGWEVAGICSSDMEVRAIGGINMPTETCLPEIGIKYPTEFYIAILILLLTILVGTIMMAGVFAHYIYSKNRKNEKSSS